MIVYPVNTKDLVIPSGLGVAEPTSVAVSGITEEECQEMIDESLEGYYTSGQTDEKLQDYATTADTADLQRQIDDISGMTPEDVQQIVDDSLVDYATTAVTSDLQDQINALTGQTGTEVEWNQIETGGTKIAEITIDGQKTDVYAPQGGQGGVTSEQVQQQIDSALTGYYTSGQTDTLLEGYATTADTESISESASSAYDAVYYEDESGETRNQIDELWEQKQDTLVEGDGIDLSVRHTESASHVPYRGACRKRSKCHYLRNLVLPVALLNVIYDLLSSLYAEVNIYIRHADAFRIEKTLEDKIISDRIYLCDIKSIGNNASCRRASAGAYGNVLFLCIFYKIVHHKKVVGIAH